MNRFLIWFGWSVMLGSGLLLALLAYTVESRMDVQEIHTILIRLVSAGLAGGLVCCLGVYLKMRTDHARWTREALMAGTVLRREH
jgi:hypothetical protein